MRALILAAGFGSRLMPLTREVPKCMVEYQGKRIIDYEIEALKSAGITEIAVVGGYLFEVLKEYLRDKHGISCFFENKNYATTNMVETLFCAREWMESCLQEKRDLLISYADIVYFKNTVKRLLQGGGDFGIIVDREWRSLWEKRFENPLEDAETMKIAQGKVLELGKKPKDYSEICGQYIGLFKFSYAFLPRVLGLYDSLDKNAHYDGQEFCKMYMTSFLQTLIDKYHNAEALEIYGDWCEIDFKSDLEIKIGG